MMRSVRTHGFTLVEMMVAIVIFLLFISAVYGTYRAANRSIAMAEEQEDLMQTGRVLLERLHTELTCAMQPASSQTSELIGEDTEENASNLLQADRITFLTTAHPAGSGTVAGDVCRVSYMMGGDTPAEEPGLYVEVNRHAGLEMPDEQPERQLLSPLVVGLNVKYLPVDGDWEPSWQERTTLPLAVRVELTLQPPRSGAAPVVLATTANPRMATAPGGAGASNAQQ